MNSRSKRRPRDNQLPSTTYSRSSRERQPSMPLQHETGPPIFSQMAKGRPRSVQIHARPRGKQHKPLTNCRKITATDALRSHPLAPPPWTCFPMFCHSNRSRHNPSWLNGSRLRYVYTASAEAIHE